MSASTSGSISGSRSTPSSRTRTGGRSGWASTSTAVRWSSFWPTTTARCSARQVLDGLALGRRACSPSTRERNSRSSSRASTPAIARPTRAAKKEPYLAEYKRPGAAAGWHFLTGSTASIERITRAVGFRYRYDEDQGQFAHASAIYVATPDGVLSRYFYGIEYAPRDLRLALVEASQGKIGSAVDQILLYCYHYDPKAGKYSAAVMNVVRLGGVARGPDPFDVPDRDVAA